MKIEEKEINKKIGFLLRSVRKSRGYTQSKVATAIGITFQQLQKYESGRNRICIFSMIEICKFCDFDPVMFFTMVNNEYDKPINLWDNLKENPKKEFVIKLTKYVSDLEDNTINKNIDKEL